MVELGQNILKTSDHGLLYLELLSPLKIFSNIYYTSYLYISAGKEIDCFDCNSHTDPRCGDPFVFTAHTRDMPPVKQCDGCCVKLVQHRGTEYESVRRTCTDEIDINLFMVDHVCMTEGGKDGIMCFCEENKCNTASSRPLLTLPTLVATTIFYNVLNGGL